MCPAAETVSMFALILHFHSRAVQIIVWFQFNRFLIAAADGSPPTAREAGFLGGGALVTAVISILCYHLAGDSSRLRSVETVTAGETNKKKGETGTVL